MELSAAQEPTWRLLFQFFLIFRIVKVLENIIVSIACAHTKTHREKKTHNSFLYIVKFMRVCLQHRLEFSTHVGSRWIIIIKSVFFSFFTLILGHSVYLLILIQYSFRLIFDYWLKQHDLWTPLLKVQKSYSLNLWIKCSTPTRKCAVLIFFFFLNPFPLSSSAPSAGIPSK